MPCVHAGRGIVSPIFWETTPFNQGIFGLPSRHKLQTPGLLTGGFFLSLPWARVSSALNFTHGNCNLSAGVLIRVPLPTGCSTLYEVFDPHPIGVFQDRCRVNHLYAASRTCRSESLCVPQGHNWTAPTGSQLRVAPDQRCGFFSLAD